MKSYEVRVEAFNTMLKTVGNGNEKAGNVYLPKSWAGKKVMVVLMEPQEEED